MGCLTNCVNSRFVLRIRRNQTIQRTTRRMDKAPNGIWSSCPATVAFIAWILSLTSSCLCTFITRSVRFSGTEEGDRLDGSAGLLLRSQGIGFWGWQGDEGTCFSYEIAGNSPSFDGAFHTASAFTTITDALGGLVMVCLMLGTVFPVEPKSYEYLGYASLLMAVVDATTLAIMGSSVCSPGFFQYALDSRAQADDPPELENITTASCGLGVGSILAILAAILWLVAAFCILRTPLASRQRETKAYRGHHKDDDEGDGDENDEAHQLARQRNQENDKRYRELMGEDDRSVDDDEFQSLRVPPQAKLSLVKEEDSGDDVSGTQRASGADYRSSDDDNFEDEHSDHDDHDQHSETRSHYSSEREQEPGDQKAPILHDKSSRRSSAQYSDRDDDISSRSSDASSKVV